MKKIIRSAFVVFMCILMVFSTVSMAFAVSGVKTLTLKSSGINGVSLSWSAVSGADGYCLYRYSSGEKKWKAIKYTSSRTYKDTTVTQGETYQYRVKAYEESDGKKVYSDSFSNTVKTVIPPKKVTGLRTSGVKGSSITLKWDKNSKATGYTVYQYNSSKKKYQKVADTTKTTYTVKNLKSTTTYKFCVKAYVKSGSVIYGAASSAVSVTTKLPDVVGFTVSEVTDSSYTLSWNKVSGVTGYKIAKYDSATGKWKVIKTTSKTSYKISGDNAKTPTEYKIRTYLKSDGKTTYGAYSDKITGTVRPAAPKNLKGALNSDNGISLSWSKVASAKGYTVYSYSAQNGTWKTVGSTTKTSFNVKNLTKTDTYRYSVSAYVYAGGKKVHSEKCESVSVFFESEGNSDSIYSEEMEKSGILGYLYDPKEKCFYTSADPWQRVVGYNEAFDVMGPFTLISFDTMRLRFEYQDKDWMIQLWKGQYGLVFYGAEVGVYTKPKDRAVKHYDAASDSEMLKMSMTFLMKNSKGQWIEKFSRPYGFYWWCTGFLPGNKYGKFDTMKLDMRITMKDYEMLSGVTAALKENGVPYTVKGLDVYFMYE